MPAWKHSQYFFRQPDFLQLQPLLCRACTLADTSSCAATAAFVSVHIASAITNICTSVRTRGTGCDEVHAYVQNVSRTHITLMHSGTRSWYMRAKLNKYNSRLGRSQTSGRNTWEMSAR